MQQFEHACLVHQQLTPSVADLNVSRANMSTSGNARKTAEAGTSGQNHKHAAAVRALYMHDHFPRWAGARGGSQGGGKAMDASRGVVGKGREREGGACQCRRVAMTVFLVAREMRKDERRE